MLYPIQNSVRNKLDISGIWDFKTDPDGVGEANGWANGLTGSRPMAVPGSWNEQYEDLFGYLDLAWYVKRTYVPQSWQGQRVFLRVGSAVLLWHRLRQWRQDRLPRRRASALRLRDHRSDPVGRGKHRRHQRRERAQADARALRQHARLGDEHVRQHPKHHVRLLPVCRASIARWCCTPSRRPTSRT